MLRKAAETDVHAAGFGTKIGGLRPSDASQGFFDTLKRPAGAVLLRMHKEDWHDMSMDQPR